MTMAPIDDWAAARSDKWRRQLAGMEAMLAPLDEPLIRALGMDRPLRMADIGCGGGATTVAALRRAPAGSVAHGFDLSPALIEVARRRNTRRNASLAFEVADMGHAPPPQPAYERLVSRLGVMFFDDERTAFANLRRWLVPGGRFAFAVWGPLADNEWMAAARASVAEVVKLPPVESSVPGPFRYGDARTLLSLLETAGFAELKVSDWRGTVPVGGGVAAPAAADFALASFSSFAEVLSGAGGDALVRARRALTRRLEACEQTGVVLLDARVNIVTGVAKEG